MSNSIEVHGVEVTGPVADAYAPILTADALSFVATLARRFESARVALLAKRRERQQDILKRRLPDFLPETAGIRDGDWTVGPIPRDLLDRRVEITGPPERKMIINALNSGANVYMADFEDSNSPTWGNNLQGQVNLIDAVNGGITYINAEGRHYSLRKETATLLVRPRGLHLVEKHLLVDGEPVAGSLFDFGLYFFHNAKMLLARGSGPYFYIPKLESHLEARWWNDVFVFAQEYLGIARGAIRATVLIETILAAFEMDEILYELREHSAGLNCGRWDYIFSFIKKLGHRRDFVLPDRASVTMDQHFLNSYVMLLIKTCHRRKAHAMGGMAAQIPIKNDPQANERALEKVRQDKLREVKAGHDGTWVAHPALAPVAKAVFDAHMKGPNQIDIKREDVNVRAEDLLTVPAGEITDQGLGLNLDVSIQYLESWLRGNGCVPIYNLMEDAATAEISRAQVWQWAKHQMKTKNGKVITPGLVNDLLSGILEGLQHELGEDRMKTGKFDLAAKIVEELTASPEMPEFLTLPASQYID